jgi:uncharacterized protein YkwD
MQRRTFLQSLSVPFGVALLDPAFSSAQESDKFSELRANLLEMVNEERAVEKLKPVQMDELATRVATAHATEMAMHEFASHWGRDGSSRITAIRSPEATTPRRKTFRPPTTPGPTN